MLRFLILILILIYLAYVANRLIGRLLARGGRPRATEPIARPTSAARAEPSSLIACPACGVHFVADRGHRADGERYCSRACHTAVARSSGPRSAAGGD